MRRLLSIIALAVAPLPLACGAQDADAPPPSPRRTRLALQTSDPVVRDAIAALEQGRPFRATQLLAPILADSARRTREATLVAAEAAAGWEGWREVQRLLAGASWVDSLDEGRGRLLLTRAALELRDAGPAVTHATAALADARGEAERGERLAFLARALDQLDQRDSAARTYAAAAALVPDVADWLLLRAAGVESAAAEREALYRRVTLPAARERVPWTELAARERFRDFAGAASLADSIGEPARALRLRLLATPDSASRAPIRAALVELVQRRAGTTQARDAVAVLDASFPALAPAEELAVARSTVVSGPGARAATAYGRAAALLTPNDRLRWGELLIRLNRDAEAAQVLARVTSPAPIAAAAAYQRARALLGSQGRGAAQTALRALRARYPSDTSAVNALALLADLATDDGRDADARTAFAMLVRQHPESRHAPVAAFRGAIVAIANGDARAAARALDSAIVRWPRSPEINAARYWAGRAWATTGDSAAARERWRTASSAEPLSYYAALAARKLGETPWAPPAGGEAPADAVVAGHARRAATLEQLGMDVEARFEYEALSALGADTTRGLAAAAALVAREQPSRAINVGWRVINAGTRDARAYRAAYPVLERELIATEAARHQLDPALIAALIRQESSFTPRATSAVGARGLMQVMPTVGASLARARGIAPWDPVLLYQPDVNVVLGTAHLAAFLRQYPALPYALAAYNAGPSRVTAWRRKTGTADPELFVERIPFVETRDYVRIVQRNRDLYQALYDWK